MRLGIAGAGMIVRGLFTFIHEVEGVELEAIASTEKSIDKVRKLAKENHVKKAYLNYDELLMMKVLMSCISQHLIIFIIKCVNKH